MKMSEPLKKVVSFDKTPISYLFKKGGKGCVLFLHGLGGGHQCWKPIYDYLNKKSHTVIALDLRSHGKSGKPTRKENCNIGSVVKDIDCILKKEKIKELSLVGHSYGTFVATTYYAKNPKKVKNLVLLGAHHRPDTDQRFALGIKIFLLIPKLLSLFFRKDRYLNVNFSKYRGRTDYDIPKICKEVISVNPSRYLTFSSEMKTFNAQSIIPKIEVPLLLVHGTRDICVNKDMPYEYNNLNPNSRLVYYNGMNHHTPVNCPDDLKKILYEFIESDDGFDKKMQRESVCNEKNVFTMNPTLS